MPQVPREPSGWKRRDHYTRELVRYVRSLRPIASPGSLTTHTTGGVVRTTSPTVGGGSNLNFRGMWSSAEAYEEGDIVTVVGSGQGTWLCQVAHGPSPDDHAPYLGEDDGTDQYWTLLIPAAAGAWV